MLVFIISIFLIDNTINSNAAQFLYGIINRNEIPESNYHTKDDMLQTCTKVINNDLTGDVAELSLTNIAHYVILLDIATREVLIAEGVKL